MTMTATQNFELTEAEFRQISALVYAHCGINLHDGKKDLVRARIAKQLREGGFSSAADYLAHVQADRSGQGLLRLIDAISTNLTAFYREPSHFRYLSEVFLPKLLKRKSEQHRLRVRAWSAGCSSGEEAYTLAMVLDSALQGSIAWDARILATDISTQMLDIARTGEYPASRVQNVPAEQMRGYFTSDPKRSPWQPDFRYVVRPALRQLVTFRRLNLMDQPWPFNGRFDFIFCRNVMIYFDQMTQQRLVARYWESLENGGLLFTGHAESLTGVSHRFRYVEPTIYEKA